MRDKEIGGQFRLISQVPFTFACMYIILGGILRLNGWCETSWLKPSKPFFTVCWFFISSLCEDRGGCCGATSQNSWSGTCTFCTSWYLKTHQPFWIVPSLLTSSLFFFRNQRAGNQPLSSLIFTLYMMVHSPRLAKQVTANLAHVHTKADTFQNASFFLFLAFHYALILSFWAQRTHHSG